MKLFLNPIKLATLLLAGASISQIASAGGPSHAPSLVPSEANAGECYARIKIPAQYSTSAENVMVEEEYSTVEVEQPQFATRQQEVMVKEASVRYEVRQPQYKTVSEKMLVRPAYDKLSVRPPQFRTVSETVQTSAPRTVWKRGNPGKLAAQGYTVLSVANAGASGRGYSSTSQYGAQGTQCGDMCEIWCLVEEPGETTTYNRKVMTSSGDVRRSTVPAKYTHISKQIVSDPGGVREIPLPAEYRNVTVEDLVHPGGERYVNIPPKYAGVAKKTLIAQERYEWRRVACKSGTVYSGRANRTYSGHASMNGYSRSVTRPSTSHRAIYGTTGSMTRQHSSRTYGQNYQGRTTQSGQSGRSYYYGSNQPVEHHRHKSYR